METTTTNCIPCVPSILQGFRRGGGGACKGGGKGREVVEEDSDDLDGMPTEAESRLIPSNNKTTKTTTTLRVIRSEPEVSTNAGSTNLPSLVSLSGVSSTATSIRTYQLRKGRTSFGRSSLQDIIIDGSGVDDEHCYIINEGQIVTFYPLGVLNSLDGFRITKPTKLSHGSVLCFGHSLYFRFNQPPAETVKSTQRIVIKGSSPNDENRRRLIKLQSKPSAQEINEEKTNYPVPDASQFHWIDFDEELGLKQTSSNWSDRSNRGASQLVGNQSLWTRPEPYQHPTRAVRNSLPLSHRADAPVKRSRFLSQGLETYPLASLEFNSPTQPTFLPSQRFTHEPEATSARHSTRFSLQPDVVGDRTNVRPFDDESDSGTPSTETSSLSSSSRSSGVKVSLVERAYLKPQVTKGCTELHETSRQLTVLPIKASSGSLSSGNSPASYGGYDNIANIKAAIIAAAAAKLANCSKPPEIKGFKVTHSTASSESRVFSIPSQITSSCNVPLTRFSGVEFAEETSTDVSIQKNPRELPETSIESLTETDINGVSETRPSNVSCSESDTHVCNRKPDDASERCELQSPLVEPLNESLPEQVEKGSASKSDILKEFCSPGAIVATGVNVLTVLTSTNLNCIQSAIIDDDSPDNSLVAQTDKTVDLEPQVPLTVSKESQPISLIKKPLNQLVKINDLEACDASEKQSNDSSAGFISPTENVKPDAVCLTKPPIGKPIPETCKPSKSERKSIKSEKKPSEPVASSLFKSFLSRSRSPSPKGRANRSPSPSSSRDQAELSKCPDSLLHEAEKGGSSTCDNLSKSFKQDDVHDKEKCSSEALTQRPVNVGHVNSENLLQDSENERLQNPWRVNLKHSLNPNLENFKGEKVFTKDTVTTNLRIGVQTNDSTLSSATVFTSNAENLMKDFRITKTVQGPTNLSDSAQDLRTVNSADQHVDIDFGYISDSGLSVTRGFGRPVKFTTLGRSKGKKSVTFAEESKSLANLADSSQDDAALAMSQNMDRVVEGRSPTEKLSVSENVRTYLEMVDSGWPKVQSQDEDLTTSNPANSFSTNQNGSSDKKIGSKASAGSDFPEFNNNSSVGTVTGLPDNNLAAGYSQSKLEERESMNVDDIDVEDLGASQQDLKELYQRRKAERMEEQQRAKVEQQRLEEILKMCSEFGLNIVTDRSQDQSDDRKLSLRSNLLDQCGVMITSSSSNSEDDAAERGTIKRRPILDKANLVCPSSSSTLDSASIFRLENNRLSDERDVLKGDLGIDDLSPASPVVDSGIDISTMDRPFASLHSSSSSSAREGKEFASLFGERRPSLEHQCSGERARLEERRPSEECWPLAESRSPRHLGDETELSSGKYSFNSRGLFQEVWRDEKLKHVQLDLLRELQRDVVQSIADIKQKIADTETRQSEAVREVEMERALLEGEQQIQMEQLDRIKEKIISLERKEANLLAEAASQRAKEVEKICLEKEKLTELEKQMNLSRELVSRTLKTEEAEMLKRRCLELQDTVDTQRFLVDNLEFQQLEAEAHYEEEKEIIQNELKAEKDYLESLSSQHQATLKQIASQQSDLLKQVDLDVFELEKERHLLAEQFQKENTMLYNINRQIQEALPSPVSDDIALDEDIRPSRSNPWHRPRLMETEAEVAGRSTFGSPRKVPTKFPHTIPKMDTLPRSRPVGEISDDEERRFLQEFKARSASRLMWDRSCDFADGGGGGGTGALVQWQGTVANAAATSESEESSVSGSDPLSDKAMSLSSKEDQLHDMECLLVLAKAEGLRMVEEQIHQRDIEREALELERRRRKELERRLAQEIAKHNDVIEQAIKLREKEKLQARPLTRYLPVRDRSLDLLQFIIVAGHSVDQCAHLAMTSVSCRGYLTKMGSRIRTWKKRWFVFDRTKRCLSYYGDKSESRPRGVIYFQAIEDVFVDHLHQVKSPTPQLTFCVKTFDRMYYLVAPSPDAMRIWIDVIFTGAEGYQQFA